MVELPKSSPEEEIPSPLRRYPVVKPVETVGVSEELREEGVEEVPLPEERFQISKDGDLRPTFETKIDIPEAQKAAVGEGLRWAGERLRRLQLKRQLGKP